MSRAIIALTLLIITFAYSVPQAETDWEQLDDFYAEEFKKISTTLQTHIDQLDICLAELNRFEQGDMLIEPVECPKFDEMRLELVPALEKVQFLNKERSDLLRESPHTNQSFHILARSNEEVNNTNALMRLYTTKYVLAEQHEKRVRQQEKEAVDLSQRFAAKITETYQQVVKQVQERLNQLEYFAGRPDGFMGPKTEAAIRAFQNDTGLPVDGKISEELNNALLPEPIEQSIQENKRPSAAESVGIPKDTE